jgi:hypothetical protein
MARVRTRKAVSQPPAINKKTGYYGRYIADNFAEQTGYDFHFEVTDPELKDNPEVKKWLAECEKVVKKQIIKDHDKLINDFVNYLFCFQNYLRNY